MRCILFGLIILLTTSCASPSLTSTLDKLDEGMDKDMVLNKAGNPKYTFRANGQDHWVYVFFQDNQEFSRQVDFLDGKVVKIGRPVAKQTWTKELDDTQSLEEYEKKVRELQQKKGKFKDVGD